MNKFLQALQANKMAQMGKVVKKSTPVVRDEDLSLGELRVKYPRIKANSQVKFLQKLKENV